MARTRRLHGHPKRAVRPAVQRKLVDFLEQLWLRQPSVRATEGIAQRFSMPLYY
jgi:hypothetical protein